VFLVILFIQMCLISFCISVYQFLLEDISVYFIGIKQICVHSAEEAYHILLYGQHNLRVAATGLNSLSSRSHCIFTIKLLQHLESENHKSIQIST
jgi:Kinesin-like protein